jgi:hypothetical protein
LHEEAVVSRRSTIVSTRLLAMLIACAAALALAACVTPARFPTQRAMQLRVDDHNRDLAVFDQVAAATGFTVTDRSHRDEMVAWFRFYQNPGRCCLGVGLGKRHDEPIWEVWPSDPYAGVGAFRAPECAMYANFRETLVAKIGIARIIEERPLTGC